MNGFEKYDKPRMNQLPGESYTLCDYKYFLKVPDNYHLEYDAHYYSVLYTYKGKLAILKATMNLIIKGKHKKTLIFLVFSGDSVLYSDSCLVVIWVL